MKQFKDTATFDADGKVYKVALESSPFANMVTAEVVGLDTFILKQMGGKFRTFTGKGMTLELLDKLNDYIERHIL